MVGIGIYVTYIYYTNLSQNDSPLLLIPGILLIVFGLAFFFLAFKTIKQLQAEQAEILADSSIDHEGLAHAVERNNQLAKEWSKTDSARNKLKILQAAGGAGEDQ